MKISDTINPDIHRNPAYNNILTRTSVRRYKPDAPLTDSQITAIVHAALAAPSGVNRQPWELVVVDDPDTLKALANALPYAKMAAHAPLAIAVCGNKDRFLDGIDSNLWEQDCSAMAENILLAAHAIGLGGVWTCLYPHLDRMNHAKQLLSIPDNVVPFCLIPIGYPDHDHAPMDKWHPEHIHINRF